MPDKLTLVLVGVFGLFVSLCATAFMTYISFKRLEEIEGYLARSACVRNTRSNWGGGVIGRTFRILTISSMLDMKGFFIRHGELDPEDAKAFPKTLERLITWPGRVLIVSGVVWLSTGAFI